MKKTAFWKRTLFIPVAFGIISGASLLLAGCAGAPGPAGSTGPAGPAGPPGPQGTPAATIPGTGLHADITKVEIGADRKPVVSFFIHDGKHVPLKISDLDGFPSFMLAFVKQDAVSKMTQYVSYTVSDVKGAPYTFEGATVQPLLAEVKSRPAVDQRATTPPFPADHPQFKDLGEGNFTYTFTTILPDNFDQNATHRVTGQFTRATRTFAANPTLDFVPAGGAVQVTRDVVATASCNQCHDPLTAHGGSRIETKYCIACHTSQTIDPETGNTVEFNVLVHRIHWGASLPSVVAGKDYAIVGNSQNVHDYSAAASPQDVRNCTTCHGVPPKGMKAEDYAKLAPNADNWKTKPSRAACGACHDNIDWATGKSTITGQKDHAGGAQKDDSACTVCHVADSGKEFDASVVGAHTIPAKSKQLKGINVAISRITNTAPGQTPQVVFTAKDNSGTPLKISDIASLTFNVNGPSTDFVQQPATESAALNRIVTNADGSFAYTLARPISINATGTYAIGMEARRTESITGNEGATTNVSGASYNPVTYVPVTDKVAVPRRQIVSTENCNVCHDQLALHGGGRLNATDYCQFCHNPAVVDVPQNVPPTLGGPFNVPPQSISLQLMIHRIHTGAELTRDFTIYRTRGVFNFNEIEFPGDRSNCTKCHVGTSYTLPLPDTNANTIAPREFYSPLGPAAAACLGCHDTKPPAVHSKTMTDEKLGEACANCHGVGKELDVQTVH